MVMTLVPVISFAIFANFSSGFRIWKAVNREVPHEDAALFASKVAVELGGALRYAGIPFSGDGGRVTFCAPIQAAADLGGSNAYGQVDYVYDAGQKAILREERDLNALHKEKEPRVTRVLERVEACEISYFYEDKSRQAFAWNDSWIPEKPESMPTAVRFTFEIERDGQRHSFRRTAPVLAGS